MTGQIHFTVEQVEKLLAMQDQLNCYIHPEWKKQNFDWNFAIIDECREIKEHLGWKWWKENYQCGLTEQNRKQVQLEVIDILHFVLSRVIADEWFEKDILRWFNEGAPWAESTTMNEMVYCMLNEAVNHGVDICECWTALAILSGLTTEQVIETYTQKFVLNKFRQDHGYKDGSYCKEWEVGFMPGLNTSRFCKNEDNEVLAFLVNRFTSLGWDTTDEQALYKELELLYNSRLNK